MGKKKTKILQSCTTDSFWFDLIKTGIKCTLVRGSSGLKFEIYTENDLEAIALENLLGGRGKVSSAETTFTVEYVSVVRDLPGVRGISFKRVNNE